MVEKIPKKNCSDLREQLGTQQKFQKKNYKS